MRDMPKKSLVPAVTLPLCSLSFTYYCLGLHSFPPSLYFCHCGVNPSLLKFIQPNLLDRCSWAGMPVKNNPTYLPLHPTLTVLPAQSRQAILIMMLNDISLLFRRLLSDFSFGSFTSLIEKYLIFNLRQYLPLAPQQQTTLITLHLSHD